MSQYSIIDLIKNLQQERENVAENWQGNTANSYLQGIDYYINKAVTIEKGLEHLNEGYEYIYRVLNPDEDPLKTYGSKTL